MPTTPEAPLLIRFETNVIIPDPHAPGGSRFIVAGEDSPFRSLEEVPINLRAVIATSSPEEPDDQPRGSFEPNVAYFVTSDGRLGKKVQREISQREAELEEEQWLEDEASRPLPEDVGR